MKFISEVVDRHGVLKITCRKKFLIWSWYRTYTKIGDGWVVFPRNKRVSKRIEKILNNWHRRR